MHLFELYKIVTNSIYEGIVLVVDLFSNFFNLLQLCLFTGMTRRSFFVVVCIQRNNKSIIFFRSSPNSGSNTSLQNLGSLVSKKFGVEEIPMNQLR